MMNASPSVPAPEFPVATSDADIGAAVRTGDEPRTYQRIFTVTHLVEELGLLDTHRELLAAIGVRIRETQALEALSPWSDEYVRALVPQVVFNELPAILLTDGKPTAATQDRADRLFDRIEQAPSFRPSLVERKRRLWRQLFHAATVAVFQQGCIRYPRHRRQIRAAMLQVIACAVEAGFLLERRSRPGGVRQSRLLPLAALRRHVGQDPREFDPPQRDGLVTLWTRGEHAVEIPFDPTLPFVVKMEQRLQELNAVNEATTITYTPQAPGQHSFRGMRQLRPIHRARFTERWDWHGRLYTGRYGHQALSPAERSTITFHGEACCELDYRALHTRLLYHRLGLEYVADPYALWGAATTPFQRILAKTQLNALINAATPEAAVSACNAKLQLRTEAGKWKQGRARQAAERLRLALQFTDLSFQQVRDLAVEVHAPIAHLFGRDLGLELMRTDSQIALDVLSHLASQGIPILGLHDSFIVPRPYRDELGRAMRVCYANVVGFLPVVE